MEWVLYGILVVGALVCALLALRVNRPLTAALWLAVSSALLAALFYTLGAPEIGVIELSVGAGLVTVLFVFAISVAGNEPQVLPPGLPQPLAWGLALVAVALLVWKVLPAIGRLPATPETASFTTMLWQQRGLDVLVQSVLIFAGVLGFLGLLAPDLAKPHPPVKAQNPVEEKRA